MKILKTRDVKNPSRGTGLSAGLDFYVPNDFPGTIYLAPGEDANIPSGIKVKFSDDYVLIAHNKSGIATKKDLQVGACVIDADYQGEIHLHVRNIGNGIAEINPGEKLVQMVLLPVIHDVLEFVNTESELYPEGESERGDGAFGSTGID